MTPEEIVSQIEDGMTIGIGGWGARRKPMHSNQGNSKVRPQGPDNRVLWRLRCGNACKRKEN